MGLFPRLHHYQNIMKCFASFNFCYVVNETHLNQIEVGLATKH